jgi:hypothetical protein
MLRPLHSDENLWPAIPYAAAVRTGSLDIECGVLNGLLLVAGQTGEAVGKGVGDAEVHVGHSYVPGRVALWTVIAASRRLA